MDVRSMSQSRVPRPTTTINVNIPNSAETRMRLGLVYDLNACKDATGVTRHALAQLIRLSKCADIELHVVSGRIQEPDGLAFWESLGNLPRRELPIRTRDALRLWRIANWPPLEWWTGPVDWVYSPAEYVLPTKTARRAVTSHDALQDATYGSDRRKQLLGKVFSEADLILSVSHFNTERLREHFPMSRGKIAQVPNGADDLFFKPATDRERATIRADLGLPLGMPYLLSVANFQRRKNLERLIRTTARLPEVQRGELALVLLGSGSTEESEMLRRVASNAGPKALIRMPGYRQNTVLRAAYSEAVALVFPSLCESFGIPAIEAMAVGCPVALSNSTALPEVGGDAAWYFDPTSDDHLLAVLRNLLDDTVERQRRVNLGHERALTFQWDRSTQMLIDALRNKS